VIIRSGNEWMRCIAVTGLSGASFGAIEVFTTPLASNSSGEGVTA
jgi:hypothetical protein